MSCSIRKDDKRSHHSRVGSNSSLHKATVEQLDSYRYDSITDMTNRQIKSSTRLSLLHSLWGKLIYKLGVFKNRLWNMNLSDDFSDMNEPVPGR
jgi:hypothetical protein